MKIASVQLDIGWHNQPANLQNALGFIEKAASQNCELVIFPEMFNSGYSMQASEVVETVEGDTVSKLCEWAKKFKINIVAGLAISEGEQATNKPENSAVFINQQGDLINRYIKNFPFTLAGEKDVYQTGRGATPFALGGFSAVTFICYDLRFPELFREFAKQVDLMIVIASWPSTRQHHWELLLQARAIENQCFVIGVNRIGSDGNQLIYTGGSLVCDPMGEVLSRGDSVAQYIETDIDLNQSSAIRTQFPFLEDMKF